MLRRGFMKLLGFLPFVPKLDFLKEEEKKILVPNVVFDNIRQHYKYLFCDVCGCRFEKPEDVFIVGDIEETSTERECNKLFINFRPLRYWTFCKNHVRPCIAYLKNGKCLINNDYFDISSIVCHRLKV